MKKIIMLLTAVIVAYSGVTLATYAEADDAPGGVVMGWLLVVVALGMGLKAVLPANSTDNAS